MGNSPFVPCFSAVRLAVFRGGRCHKSAGLHRTESEMGEEGCFLSSSTSAQVHEYEKRLGSFVRVAMNCDYLSVIFPISLTVSSCLPLLFDRSFPWSFNHQFQRIDILHCYDSVWSVWFLSLLYHLTIPRFFVSFISLAFQFTCLYLLFCPFSVFGWRFFVFPWGYSLQT